MAYNMVLICGETQDVLDDDCRYLDVKTDDDGIVIHTEDSEYGVDLTIDVAEALALIRSLTEAIQDLTS